MNLLETFDALLASWQVVFSQLRMFERARRLTFGLLSCLRLHLTSTAICASGRQFVDWSADYRLCSRSPWEAYRLFDPVFDHLPSLLASPTAPVIAALDDTLCKKTGRHTYSRSQHGTRSHVTSVPCQSLLRTALPAVVRLGQSARGSRSGPSLAGAL
jgi:hypothetical protein